MFSYLKQRVRAFNLIILGFFIITWCLFNSDYVIVGCWQQLHNIIYFVSGAKLGKKIVNNLLF